MGRRALLLVAVAVTLLAAWPAGPAGAAKTKKRPAATRLHAFTSCADLVRYARRNFARSGGRVWAPLVGLPVGPPARGGPVAEGAPGAPAPTAAPDGAGSGTDYSTTNNQEAGVDEPDIVKTDGERIYAISGTKLHVIDARAPKLLGSLELGQGYGHELLLRGKRLLVVWRPVSPVTAQPVEGGPPMARSAIPPIASPGTTRIAEVDVSDAAAPKVRSTLTVDGDYVTARLNGDIARLVITSSPRVLVEPAAESARLGLAPPRRAVAPRAQDRAPGLELPRRAPAADVLGPGDAHRADDRPRPRPAGDRLRRDHERRADRVRLGEEPVRGDAALVRPARSDGPPARTARTLLHRFDASDPSRTDYRASGDVAGYLLNQFSISEFRGVLRVASTEDPVWADGQRAQDSQSSVTVLDQHGSRLDEVGKVTGLGKGERIYSVRFIDDVGYVVTFRQTDPLYTVDLADPAHPRVLGELELLGYSAYLHPVGRDLILGVGRTATEQGRLRGVQVNLFDVSDLRSPKLRGHLELDSTSYTDVEADHKAFLFWAPTDLAVLPLQITGDGAKGRADFVGALGLRLGGASGIAEAGRVVHDRDGSHAGAALAGRRPAPVHAVRARRAGQLPGHARPDLGGVPEELGS